MPEHTAVWIDHKEARIFHLDQAEIHPILVKAPLANTHHKHPPGPEGERAHPADATHFMQAVAESLPSTGSVLIVGPSNAKLDLLRHLHDHDRDIEERVVGVETVDHPTDHQLVQLAKGYFSRFHHQR